MLKSSDGAYFEVDQKVAMRSNTVRRALLDGCQGGKARSRARIVLNVNNITRPRQGFRGNKGVVFPRAEHAQKILQDPSYPRIPVMKSNVNSKYMIAFLLIWTTVF